MSMSATSRHDVATRLAVTAHQLDGVDVLEVAGELDLWTAPTLCARIEESSADHRSSVLIDLSPLQFCDSSGLRALFGAAREARVRRSRLVILGPSLSGAARAFTVAGAAEYLPLADDLESALARLLR
jgi:anti-sigma B factor antagonist